MNRKANIMLLGPDFFGDSTDTIRLCVPGVDAGCAVYLETKLDKTYTHRKAKALLRRVWESINDGVTLEHDERGKE